MKDPLAIKNDPKKNKCVCNNGWGGNNCNVQILEDFRYNNILKFILHLFLKKIVDF